MDDFIATIKQFGFSWAPHGWELCHGQLLPINVYEALFALIGTNYGGDGQTSFKLPDLRVKKSDGNYYQHGELMENGQTYLESSICLLGIFPNRD